MEVKKYFAVDTESGDKAFFDTEHEAFKFLQECAFDSDGILHDEGDFLIYKLESKMAFHVLDEKLNYECQKQKDRTCGEFEDELCEECNDYNPWPYSFKCDTENGAKLEKV